MMWDRKQIKAEGKIAFKGNYWKSVIASILIWALTGGSSLLSGSHGFDQDDDDAAQQVVGGAEDAFNNLPENEKTGLALVLAGIAAAALIFILIGIALRIFVFNPLKVGCYGFFRDNANKKPVDLNVLKEGFDNYKHNLVTMLLTDIFIFLWFCLLLVPGIIKAYSYRMVPFIVRDNPDLPPREVINASRRLMDGNKWKTFVFDLSYIGWVLLGVITLGLVNIFWTGPYYHNANAKLYLTLIGEEDFKGFTQEEVEPPVIALSRD